MTLANILDPVHDGLSPFVFDHPDSPRPVLKKAHATWIKTQIYAVLTSAGYTDVEKWLHLVLTGSLTTYQYSDDSDVDVSLFVDAKIFPDWSRAEMIGVMVSKMDGKKLPGTPFMMQDFVVPPGIAPNDLYKEGLRSGYDIDKHEWIVPPEKSRVHDVESEQNGFYAYALQMADKMERLLRYEPDKAVEFWHQIHAKRQRDQRSGKGDFSESNIVYKFLANRGLFPQISGVSGEYIAKVGAGADTQDFFTDAQRGNRAPLQQLQPQHVEEDPIYVNQQQYFGPFDRHIETSIPDFRNNAIRKQRALLGMGGGRLLDIGSSTGSFGKSLSDMSRGAWQTDSLDPNPEMQRHFEQTPVQGARAIPAAFGESVNEAPPFEPESPYDVVHESMGFQFMHPDRQAQVLEAKRMMHPNGLFLSEEKFHTPQEAENERIKDEQFKNQYYTPQALQQKQKDVGFQGQGTMSDNLAHQQAYANLLGEHFNHVAPYWQSGNFAGYAASDDPERLNSFLQGMR